jgi:hypothetical protein
MKYSVETGSDAKIYVRSFIMITSSNQLLIWEGGGGDTQTGWRSYKLTL